MKPIINYDNLLENLSVTFYNTIVFNLSDEIENIISFFLLLPHHIDFIEEYLN